MGGNSVAYGFVSLINLSFINPAITYFKVVIVRSQRLLAEIRIGLDRTIQSPLGNLDSPIESENDHAKSFMYLSAEVNNAQLGFKVSGQFCIYSWSRR